MRFLAKGQSLIAVLAVVFVPALAAADNATARADNAAAVRRGVIKACVGHNGDARIVPPSEACRKNENAVFWNVEGPMGPPGGPGPKGDPGAPGAPGLPGRDGLNGRDGVDGKDGRDGRDGQDCTGGGTPPAPGALGTLSIDGIHKPDEPSELLSVTGGLTVTASGGGGGGGGAGKANFQDISVIKFVDAASPKEFMVAAMGTHIKTVDIVVFRKGTQIAELTYGLEDVLITSIQQGGSGGQQPTESVTFNFEKIKIKFTPETGPEVNFCFDVKLNKSCS